MEKITGYKKNNLKIEGRNIMRKNLVIMMICLVGLASLSYAEGKHGAEIKQLREQHKLTQKSENATFKASLVGKTKEERVALKAAHRATQQKENEEFKAQMETKKAQWQAEKAQRETEQNVNGDNDTGATISQ